MRKGEECDRTTVCPLSSSLPLSLSLSLSLFLLSLAAPPPSHPHPHPHPHLALASPPPPPPPLRSADHGRRRGGRAGRDQPGRCRAAGDEADAVARALKVAAGEGEGAGAGAGAGGGRGAGRRPLCARGGEEAAQDGEGGLCRPRCEGRLQELVPRRPPRKGVCVCACVRVCGSEGEAERESGWGV